MRILAIESSCDESAAAIVEDGRTLLANAVQSQVKMHAEFGGVVPELASRAHVAAVIPVIEACLRQAGLTPEDMDAVAVTAGPGLAGSLLVGVSAAKALAYAAQKPLYAIHHIAAHIAANFLSHPDFEPPFLALVASGGHSHLIYCDDSFHFQIVGRSRDDAAGEALDKIARALGLAYPGGPEIERLARKGNPKALRFPKPKLEGDFDYSFSGVKTAGLNALQKLKQEGARRGVPWQSLLSEEDFCASYQEAVFAQLEEKVMAAASALGVGRIALAGGVAANRALRERLADSCARQGKTFYVPELVYCTDNAAMVAAMAYFEILGGKKEAGLRLNAQSVWDAEKYAEAAPRR